MKRFRLFPFTLALALLLAFAVDAQAQSNALFPGDNPTADYRLYIKSFYNFAVAAGILIATVLIMIGGMIWVTSAGNPGRIDKAKSYILDSIIGVILLISAYTILQVINPTLVRVPPIDLRAKFGDIGACRYERNNGKVFCSISSKDQCTKGGSAFPAGVFTPNQDCDDICAAINTDGSCVTQDLAKTRAENKARAEAALAGLEIQKLACSKIIQTTTTFGNFDRTDCEVACRAMDPMCTVFYFTYAPRTTTPSFTETLLDPTKIASDQLNCSCTADQKIYEERKTTIMGTYDQRQ